MKKVIRLTVAAGIIAASLISLIGCGDASQKHAANAKENMKEAGEDLKEAAITANEEAKTKATADWQQFKNESDSTIAVMEKQIQKGKEKIASKNKKEREKISADLKKAEEKLHAQKEKLKQKSIEFEAELKQFDESAAAKNESFKMEFKHDMDELGTALKDLFKDNVK